MGAGGQHSTPKLYRTDQRLRSGNGNLERKGNRMVVVIRKLEVGLVSVKILWRSFGRCQVGRGPSNVPRSSTIVRCVQRKAEGHRVPRGIVKNREWNGLIHRELGVLIDAVPGFYGRSWHRDDAGQYTQIGTPLLNPA